MIAFERRASTVLFNVLRDIKSTGVFLLPANICPLVPLVFQKAGTPFELVDIEADNLCMDRLRVLRLLDSQPGKYGGVLFARTYGLGGDFSPFFHAIKAINASILTIDDRCLCPPAPDARPEADIDLILYSTGYAKYADIGQGGFGILADGHSYSRTETRFDPAALAAISLAYKAALDQRTPFCQPDSDWLDTRPPEIDWDAYRDRIISETEKMQRHKATLNAIYAAGLPGECQLTESFQQWRFNILVENRDELLQTIRESGLFASNHYASLAGIFAPGQTPIADRLGRLAINLFNDRYFDAERACQLIEMIRVHCKAQHSPSARR
jgi:hypothetical protein